MNFAEFFIEVELSLLHNVLCVIYKMILTPCVNQLSMFVV